MKIKVGGGLGDSSANIGALLGIICSYTDHAYQWSGVIHKLLLSSCFIISNTKEVWKERSEIFVYIQGIVSMERPYRHLV